MLTLVDMLSLAGDRGKQNDDAAGAVAGLGWVIDGATDVHDEPLSGWATDAAWIGHGLNRRLSARSWNENIDGAEMRAALRDASAQLRAEFLAHRATEADLNSWKSPIASVLMAAETAEGVCGADMGDCRFFALDAAGKAHVLGGPSYGVDREAQTAAKVAQAAKHDGAQLYRTPEAREVLRDLRARQVANPSSVVFGLHPERMELARLWSLTLARPAHLLLASDGFSALVDRYGAYDSASLMRACVQKGMAALTLELREIEAADAGGQAHPRFKRSDDATALLLRLT